MMHGRTTMLVSALFFVVAFAGCLSDENSSIQGSLDSELQEGKGAIKGLLVDDRYRPIHLVEDGAGSEFQATGFILIQEIAQEIRTNANGEFEVLNLAPGTYTLKVQSVAHEARTATVNVVAAKYSEATVEARRTASDEGAIIVQQYAVFIPCAIWIVATGMVQDCTLDQSGDSMRADFSTDLSAYPDITYVVTEMQANRVDDYGVQIRGDARYAVSVVTDQDYLKIINQPGIINEVDVDPALGPNEPFKAAEPFQTIFFAMGDQHKTFASMGVPGVCCGYGVKLATKGEFIQSAFIGQPDEGIDIESYCVLC